MTPREQAAALMACFGSALVVFGFGAAFGIAGAFISFGVVLLTLSVLIGIGE